MRRWPDPLLYWPVILLEHVVQVFARIAPVRGAEISEVLRQKKEGHKTRDRSKRRDRSEATKEDKRRDNSDSGTLHSVGVVRVQTMTTLPDSTGGANRSDKS
jgi:hypothetical protein